MLYNIPIEKLEERYSADWYNYFTHEFKRLHIKHITVYPQPLSSDIQQGSFLDVSGTNYFKAKQLSKICEMVFAKEIKARDIFFFGDLWFPGIEMLAYIRDGMDLDFKICGILHAGTYDPYDFLHRKGMHKWGEDLENSWFKIFDAIFVATNFHKELLTTTRKVPKKKIFVTGLPIYPDKFVKERTKKENIVVFPHRLDPEKNPETFDTCAKKFRKIYPDWKFIKTKDVCSNKQEYYNLLNKAKIAVSFADQETWGIAMQEATFCGCIPLVPNKLSYFEMYKPIFKYKDLNAFEKKLALLMRKVSRSCFKVFYLKNLKEQQFHLKKEGELAIRKMVRIMKGKNWLN